jgi:hypothetical protein
MIDLQHFHKCGAAKCCGGAEKVAAPHLPIKGVRVRHCTADGYFTGAAILECCNGKR